MSDDIRDLLDSIKLDDISDLEDITQDDVDEILYRYDIEDHKENHAENIIDDAYAKANEEEIEDVEITTDELERLHDDINYDSSFSTSNQYDDLDRDLDDELDDELKKINSKNIEFNESDAEEYLNEILKEGKDIVELEDFDNLDLKEQIESDIELMGNIDKDAYEEIKENVDLDALHIKSTVDNSEEIIDVDNLESVKENEDTQTVIDKSKNLFKKLFYNIEDEEYDKKQRKLERKEKRKKEKKAKEKEKEKEEKNIKAAEVKKKKADAAMAKKKEKDEAAKRKAEAIKKKAEKKKQAKEARKKEVENEPIGRINKLGAVVVFMFIGLITSAIVLFSFQLGKKDYKKLAKDYMSSGNYDMAYMTLLKDSGNIEESEIYEQLRLLKMLNQQISYYSSNIVILEREMALDALIKGVEIYDANLFNAKRLDIEKQYNEVFANVVTCLKDEYDMKLSEARKISKENNEHKYSELIKSACKDSKEYSLKKKAKKEKNTSKEDK